jgi:hypothetical protein
MATINTPEQVYLNVMRDHEELRDWDTKDKSSVTVLTKEVDEDARNHTKAPIDWHTGVRARFPWLGFGALMTIMVCISMTIVIMKTSHGKTRDQWPGTLSAKQLPRSLTNICFSVRKIYLCQG